MNWIKRTLILALGIYVVSFGLGLLEADNGFAVLIGGLILAGLNAFLKPALILMTLPLNLLTLGLFTIILNALILALAAMLTPGLRLEGFWSTVLAAILISLVSMIVNTLMGGDRYVVDRRR